MHTYAHTQISFLPHHPATARRRSIVRRRLLRMFGRISYYYYAVVNLKDKVKRGTREVGVAERRVPSVGIGAAKLLITLDVPRVYIHISAQYILLYTQTVMATTTTTTIMELPRCPGLL